MKRLILFLLIVGIVISMAVNTPAQQRVMSANWQAYGCQTDTATTTWDTVALGAQYEEFNIVSDSSTAIFFVSLGAGLTDSLCGNGTNPVNIYFLTDTICVRTYSGTHLVHINKKKRLAD